MSRLLGNEGEERAVEFLRGIGYTIVTRNAYSRHGEIDIVALEGDLLILVEVKLRRTTIPEESITPTKAGRMRAAARDYLAAIGDPQRDFRFDLIAIADKELRHHRGVLRED